MGASAGVPELTEAGKKMGTPQYMSPVHIHAPGEVNHRADIYPLDRLFRAFQEGNSEDLDATPLGSRVCFS